jgi:para-aminobenzoate synthetase / 4-amino-4-deoxychorismate lyase
MRLQTSRPEPRHGVFETLLVRDGRLVELDAHLARMESSLAAVFGEPVPAGVERAARERASGLALGRLRITVAPNGSGALHADVAARPVDDPLVFPGWELAVTLTRLVVPGGIGAHKWADRRLLEQAEATGAVPLVVDADGTVLEASRASVFVVEGDTISTPPADGRILPGVTRARVLALAPVREEPISAERLQAADEVFLTGSVRGVEPVRACNGVREWLPGTVTGHIADHLRRQWEREP